MSIPRPGLQLHDPSQPPPAPGRTMGELTRESSSAPRGVQIKDTDTTGVQGRNAFNSERPHMGVAPVPGGGVAVGGQPNLPEGHANIGDKVVGKTQKVIGKHTHNPDLHEKGELRETGGKAAADGRARAVHD